MNSPHPVSRRHVIKTVGVGAALLGADVWSSAAQAATPTVQPFVLPKLGYAYDALEPHFDAQTMEIHHSKHHQAYIANANNALKTQPALGGLSAEDIVRRLGEMPEAVRAALRNNVGGHLNHAHFWQVIGPKAGGAPRGEIAAALDKTFGSFDQFKTQFAAAAMGRFGSGWAWLVRKDGKLAVVSTANQDTPLSDGAVPLLGLDVWEHAYYLKYQNRRADFVAAFWQVVRWEQVAANYAAAA